MNIQIFSLAFLFLTLAITGCSSQPSRDELIHLLKDRNSYLTNAVTDRCTGWLDGYVFSLPNSASMTVIGERIFSKEDVLQVTYGVPSGKSITLESSAYRIVKPGVQEEIAVQAETVEYYEQREQRVLPFQAKLQSNAVDDDTHFRVDVKIPKPIPRQFVLFPPRIKVYGVWFTPSPIWVRYFENRNRFGLCRIM